MRTRAEPRRPGFFPHSAGRGRRRFATKRTSHSQRHVSARKTRHGVCRVRRCRRRRADHRSLARRVDHRQFFLALDFLHQRAGRHYMKRAKVTQGFRIDYIGIGLISLGLGSMQIILDKGEREDWLSSGFIQVFFVLMLIGIVAGIIWEYRQQHPVVDLRMLKDRNFAVATLAMFFLGFVLYASTVLIPQFLQEMMGYTAELAGLALSPGGAVIMFMMPVVGFLVSRVNTKYLIAFGCLVSSAALFVMAGWNLQID